MAYKPRMKSKELVILEVLNKRASLSENDGERYYRLKKGYEGEAMFDEMTEKLQCECYILNDLQLKVNNTTFQIDTLLLLQKKVRFYEVKNYEGNYFYDTDKDRLYKLPKKEYNNPLQQVIRSESLLRQLLQELGVDLPVEGIPVFINPGFTLYQAPLDRPFIFPTQVKSHLKKLDKTPSKLNGHHKWLADKLVSFHMPESPYAQVPVYRYEQVRKGLTCNICDSFAMSVHGKKCICGDCGHEECVESAILRTIKEFKLLFPDQKITTSGVMEWCGVIDNSKRISRILAKNYRIVGVRNWAYYE